MTINNTEQFNNRFLELDVFRGIAAFTVVCYHMLHRYGTICARQCEPEGYISIPGLDTFPIWYIGSFAVWCFFMISGFVIIWTLDRCRNFGDFVVSRFSRLFPTYWMAVSLTYIAGSTFPLGIQKYTALQFLLNLTMLQEFIGIDPIDGVYRTLTVELCFYIICSSILFLRLMPRIYLICMLWVSACIVKTVLSHFHIDIWWKIQRYGLLSEGHFFVAGIMLYHLWRGKSNFICFSLISLSILSIFIAEPLPVALVFTFFLGVFILAVKGRLNWLVIRPLLWLGGISYPLYVCHQMIGFRLMVFLENIGISRQLAAVLAIGMALSLATIISNLVEKPAMNAIRKWWRQRDAAKVLTNGQSA